MTMKTRLHLTCALMAILTGTVTVPGLAQAPAAPAAEEPAAEVPTAPVVIDGNTLFIVRGFPNAPAEARAQAIASRIIAFAEQDAPPESLTLVESEQYTRIMAGTTLVMRVLDADARFEGVRRSTVAESYLTEIRKAVRQFRRDRSRGVLVANAGWALGATLAFVVVLLAAYWAYRRACAVVEQRYHARVRDVAIKSFQVLRAERIWLVVTSFLKLAWAAVTIIAAYLYLHILLLLFPWTRGLGRGLASMVIAPLTTLGGGTLALVPNVIFLAVLALVTRYLLKLLRLFSNAIADGHVKLERFDPDWALPTYRLVRTLVLAFAVIVAYPYIPGSQTDAFKGLSVFIGVVFSLGSSSFIGNLIAGYSMTYRRAFRLGDRVKIAGQVGDVEKIRLMVTHLRTLKNEELVVPNSAILNSEVLNYSSLAQQRGLILHTTVGIGYETPWRQVEAMLLEAAARTPGLLRQPAPFVLQKALGDFAVTYEINAYCDDPHRMMELYTGLHGNILDVFNEYGVQIMTPAYEGDPERPKVVAKPDWFLAPARPAAPESGS